MKTWKDIRFIEFPEGFENPNVIQPSEVIEPQSGGTGPSMVYPAYGRIKYIVRLFRCGSFKKAKNTFGDHTQSSKLTHYLYCSQSLLKAKG